MTKNLTKSLTHCFDRMTGKSVKKIHLKTYLDILAQYHLHPETKFLNADYLDKGRTQRRHIIVSSIHHIGKEANKWEEQYYLGIKEEAQIEYGISFDDQNALMNTLLHAITTYGTGAIAHDSGISSRYINKIQHCQSQPRPATLSKLNSAIRHLEIRKAHAQNISTEAKAIIAEKTITINGMAKKLGIDASNLAKVLSGTREINTDFIARWEIFRSTLNS